LLFSPLKYFFFLFLLLSSSVFWGQELAVEKQFIFPLQEQNHVHSSSLVELPNGDLLACWFEGSGERKADDVKIMGARLQRGKQKWGKPFVMADTPGFPDCNPILFLNQRNELFLFWIVVKSNRWEESILKYKRANAYLDEGAPQWNWQDLILLKPGNGFQQVIQEKFKALPNRGLSWAEYAPQYEKMLVEAAAEKTKRQSGWMTRTLPLFLDSGRLLLPLYSDGFNFSLIAYTDDFGQHWQVSEPLVGYGNVQPSLIQEKGGAIHAYMRDNGDFPGRVMRSVSVDNGETWQAVEDIPIQNPGASLHMLKLQDGRWLMVNNNLEEGRNQLHLNLSEDEGKSWQTLMIIEESEKPSDSFSYPTLIQAASGLVHLSYSYRSNNQKSIVHTQLKF